MTEPILSVQELHAARAADAHLRDVEAANDRLADEVRRLQDEQAATAVTLATLRGELASANAEIEQLRGLRPLLDEATEKWLRCDVALCDFNVGDGEPHDGDECDRGRIKQIRREAGL